MKFHQCKKLFSNYADSYLTGREDFDRNIRLKYAHTLRVFENASEIAAGTGVSANEAETALFAALFHDVSRFEQFRRFCSYRDCAEFDHGQESADLFTEKFAGYTLLGDADVSTVATAIRLHNKISIPENSSFAAKCVRDADKLDVLEVILNELAAPQDERVFYSLPGDRSISDEVMQYVTETRAAPHGALKTLGDFIISKTTWVYDLNTPVAAGMFSRADYLGRLRVYLPENEAVSRVFKEAEDYLKGISGEKSQ